MHTYRYPVLIFDGPDGTGKTTNSLLLGSFLSREMSHSVAYFSFPVYEFPMGRAIGNFLGRWGERTETPTPEDAALLFALNRLETLSFITQAIDGNKIVICNRGPYANLFSVARKVLEEGTDWQSFSSGEKGQRVDDVLLHDAHFFSEINRLTNVENIFLKLDYEESMELAAQKAARDLGNSPDFHEEWSELQQLTAQIYDEIADGRVDGHQARSIETSREGRLGSFLDDHGDGARAGIRETASKVVLEAAEIFGWENFSERDYFKDYKFETSLHAYGIVRGRENSGADFEFRKVFNLPDSYQPDLWETFPELMRSLKETRPGVFKTIEVSKELDRTRGLGRERRF
jgi:thymidylate kinase